MLVHPDIDPIALQIGPLAIRWYAQIVGAQASVLSNGNPAPA